MKILDLHCDTIMKLYEEDNKSLYKNNLHVDIEKLKKADAIGQFFAVFIELEQLLRGNIDAYEQCLDMIKVFDKHLEINSEYIALAKNYKDILNNNEKNKISAILTLEEGGVIDGKIGRVKELFNLGIRLITLTWNYPNCIGYPNTQFEYSDKGLTDFGRDVVEKMNELGMIIDVSHLSDKGFYDVIELSKQPIIATHSNARGVTHHSRNLTDDMIKSLANKGGITGINYCASFIDKNKKSTINNIIKHIKHIRNIGGIDVLALGSDFDGIGGELEISDFSKNKYLLEALRNNGFTTEEVEKIGYKNALRVIKEVLK